MQSSVPYLAGGGVVNDPLGGVSGFGNECGMRFIATNQFPRVSITGPLTYVDPGLDHFSSNF